MSNSYTHSFRVRFQECDSLGTVGIIHYIYYMQETAMAHSAELGYTAESELAKGIVWVIRETEIEFLRPLHYGDTLDVTMSIGDLHRISATRSYELRIQKTRDLIARGRSEFVAVSIETLRPIPIPEYVIADFFPDGMPEKPVRRKRFPKAPPPPRRVFRSRKKVEMRDLDMQRHVNNATYLSYMETAGAEAASFFGWPVQRLLENGQFAVPRRSHVLYRGQAAMGDELEVVSYLSEVRRASWIRHDTITRVSDGAILTSGHTSWVWIDVKTYKPCPIPSEIHKEWDAYIA